MRDDTPILSISDVCARYGAVDVLHSVSLDLPRGRVFALMGKNGMGKTTLLKVILGLVPLHSGTMMLDGASIVGASPSALIAAGIAYAPQEFAIFQDLSIRDNLRLALPSDKHLRDGLDRLYAHFPLFRDRLNQKAGSLSGGEQKMLITGRALMMRPRLLLLDEISEGLQPSVVQRIADAIDAERANGTTVLMVEQNLDFALGIADHWAVLKLGRIEDAGAVDASVRDRVLAHLRI